MGDGKTPEISVLCVDDNADVASMLESLVSAQPDLKCAGCVGDTESLIEEIGRIRPNVVLLDLTMPGVDTVALIRTLASQCPDSRVLVYSGYDQPETVDDVMAAGAWGLVSKHGRFDALLEAIRRVGQGEVVLKNG